MQLLIANQTYEVKGASFYAFIIYSEHISTDNSDTSQSKLFWRLEIDIAEGMSFWSEDIQLPNLRHWTDLPSQIVTWENPYETDIDEWDSGWYGAGVLGGNSDILNSSLRFVEQSGCKLRIQWIGNASTKPIGVVPNQDENLDFSIDCWCDFHGVGVMNANGIDETTKRNLISQFLDVNDFSEQFEENPKLFVPGFMPMLRPRC